MFVFAVILCLLCLLSVIGCLIGDTNALFPFALLVFFTLYLMGVGS